MKPFALLLALALPALAQTFEAKVGGTLAPDGATEIQVDLPGSQHQANIAVNGAGCCVFRSIDHAARWANVPALIHFPEWMRQKKITGGGYPEKVTKLVKQICADRHLPEPAYLQVEDKDLAILKAATKAGRMVSVTYSRSPTKRYGGGRIAHMVNVVHADDAWICVLDNNYIGADKYEWMTPAEFTSVCNPGGYWAVILLDPGPPPPPRN